MAKKSDNTEATAPAKEAPIFEADQKGALPTFERVESDSDVEDLFQDAEDLSTSDRQFNEFFRFQNVGDSYTGKFLGIIKPEGFDDPIAIFEDYPQKGYRNVSALNVTFAIEKVFGAVEASDVADYVYRITYHAEKEAKKGTFKDLRISRAKI